MPLKDIIERKQEAAYGSSGFAESKHKAQPIVLSYDIKGNVDEVKKKTSKIPYIILISVISVFLLIVYLPQLFIKDNQMNIFVYNSEKAALSEREEYIKNNPEADFDSDGLINEQELNQVTNPYIYDCDDDGVRDGIDNKPLKNNDLIIDTLKEDGITTSSGYAMNGVIMWADNKESLLKGGVIRLKNGNYRFSDFNGWVSFGDNKVVYKYHNRTHSKLKHKEKESAWYIDDDCEVAVFDTEQEFVNRLSFFGLKTYLQDSKFASFVSAILPEKGFVTCKQMFLSDTFINITVGKQIDDIPINPIELPKERFSSNDISLNNLSNIYSDIDNGSVLYASLVNDKKGETVILIYGYDCDGNLLISDIEGKNRSVLYVYPSSTKEYTEDGKIIERTYYDFKGAGFDSKDGDTICYFLSLDANTPNSDVNTNEDTELYAENHEKEDSDAEIISSDTDTSELQNDTATEEPLKEPEPPINGTFESNGKTNYYIDGNIVLNNFIRFSDGKYEFCKVGSSGAFYIDESGQKAVGQINTNGGTYFYYNNQFYFNTVLTPNGNTYLPGSIGTKGALYINNNGHLVRGWFSLNGKDYFANQSGIIQKNVFVKNKSGQIRYLDGAGQPVSNCMITLDNVDIMFDANGNVINQSYAINIINAHLAN